MNQKLMAVPVWLHFLFWFVEQVYTVNSTFLSYTDEVGMSTTCQELLKHFTDVVLKTASKLQSWNDA